MLTIVAIHKPHFGRKVRAGIFISAIVPVGFVAIAVVGVMFASDNISLLRRAS
jgi:hypothetical protein